MNKLRELRKQATPGPVYSCAINGVCVEETGASLPYAGHCPDVILHVALRNAAEEIADLMDELGKIANRYVENNQRMSPLLVYYQALDKKLNGENK